tara:strand:- start:475 stop:825 length:351 start_codon:yes stop_codon:yes gene_type:complete
MKKKILIVIADYYKDISLGLLKSTLNSLSKKCVVKVIKVPGVFEIPVTISKNLKKYHGFIALGCVIKGQTPHFDFISKASTDAIMSLSINSKKPIGNGILTCLSMSQAKLRKKKRC